MRRIAWAFIATATLIAAGRPRYGGTLRVQMRAALESPEAADPWVGATAGAGPFRVVQWEPRRRAVLAASDDYPGGRPFVDSIEIQMSRSLRDQALDLELDKADIVEIEPAGARRASQRGIRIWTSPPVEWMGLLTRAEDPRLREAVSLALDRATMHAVLLGKHGEPAGALLPQWLSGHAFLFSTARNLEKARKLAAEIRPAPVVTLAYDASDPTARAVAERIAVDVREAGIRVRTVAGAAPAAEWRLVRQRVAAQRPGPALAGLAAALGLPARETSSPEDVYRWERELVDEARVIPLFHLPEIYGLGPRVRNWQGRLEDVWLDAGPR